MRVSDWEEARGLEHHWAGDEHTLIALSRCDGPAGEVLRGAGATPERLVAELEQSLASSDPPLERRESVSPEYTPAHYRTRGVAEGLALAAGSDPTRAPARGAGVARDGASLRDPPSPRNRADGARSGARRARDTCARR
ncbi:MAG: Clp protease N-terminal domain-containing protein [Actinobacteria bacterium]|nr:Clp protease N-terminal domain-containing protein [Actinomycetota bacterium]